MWTPCTRGALAVGLMLAAIACDDTTGPDDVAGAYEATTLMFASGDGSFDALDAGADIQLTLWANGTTTGHLFVPASEAGAEIDADLAGTWRLEDGQVVLDHGGASFLHWLDLRVQGDQLVSTTTGIQVTLRRRAGS